MIRVFEDRHHAVGGSPLAGARPAHDALIRSLTLTQAPALRVLANAKSLHGDFVHDRHQGRTNAGLRRRVTGVVDHDES
jgi:hypothetical protein